MKASFQVLTDIQGIEDQLGDMDFKVAGTADGVTALQMDIKTTGITYEIMRTAFAQAREGRLFILGKMAEVIDEPRSTLAATAPRIITLQINPEKIGARDRPRRQDDPQHHRGIGRADRRRGRRHGVRHHRRRSTAPRSRSGASRT